MKETKAKKLKSEWWELWWTKPGEKPQFIKIYGEVIPHWIPDGCYPSKKLVLEAKRQRNNIYDKIIHVRRFVKCK